MGGSSAQQARPGKAARQGGHGRQAFAHMARQHAVRQ
jgi:hypothetical protein